jgi:amino-acid N-acetyltransferase
LERQAGNERVKRLHLLTTTATRFFEQLGYVAADRSSAPPEVSQSEAFAGLCPASARYLVKDVRKSW